MDAKVVEAEVQPKEKKSNWRITDRQKRYLEDYYRMGVASKAGKLHGYSAVYSSKMVHKSWAKEYLQKLKDREEAQYQDPNRPSDLIQAIQLSHAINPVNKIAHKLDEDLTKLVEQYTKLAEQKERLSQTQQLNFKKLDQAIHTLSTYKKSVVSDPIKFLSELQKLDNESKSLALAAARGTGLIKQSQKQKDTQILFGRRQENK